jgi:hypothetical protein
MYDFVDHPLTSLDHGGRFLLWTLRNWVRALSDGRCPAATVGPAFAKWNVVAGFPPFHRLLTILNTYGLETISVAPIECRFVAEHEAIMLALVSGMEERRPEAIRDTVALLVEEEHVGSILASISSLAGAMMDAGIFPRKPQVVQRATWKPGA